MSAQQIQNQNREWANNQDMDDWLLTNRAVIKSVSGYVYEHKYHLPTIPIIRNLVSNANHVIHMQQFIKANNVGYATCKFYFGGLRIIPIALQRGLMDFQEKVFDDITTPLIGNNFGDFRQILAYAKSKDKPVASFVDTRMKQKTDLISALTIIKNSGVDYTKWLYGKFTTYLRNYIEIRNWMQELKIPYILTGCDKRCGVDQYRDIAVSLIAAKQYGFTACCRDYIDTTHRKKKGFPLNGTDTFERQSWRWQGQIVRDFHRRRQENLQNLNLEWGNITPQSIKQHQQFDMLLQNLSQLELQAQP